MRTSTTVLCPLPSPSRSLPLFNDCNLCTALCGENSAREPPQWPVDEDRISFATEGSSAIHVRPRRPGVPCGEYVVCEWDRAAVSQLFSSSEKVALIPLLCVAYYYHTLGPTQKCVQQVHKVWRSETRHLQSRKSAKVENEETQVSRDEQDPIQRWPKILQCRSPG